MDVQEFHADYDTYPADRMPLFEAVAVAVGPGSVLYSGSYVDMDRRADRFFAQNEDVRRLVDDKGAVHRRERTRPFQDGPSTSFSCVLSGVER
jgi:hypothetical protein